MSFLILDSYLILEPIQHGYNMVLDPKQCFPHTIKETKGGAGKGLVNSEITAGTALHNIRFTSTTV